MQTQRGAVVVVAVLALLSASALARPQIGRHLLNPIYSEGNVLTGPETPSYRYRATPPPATYVNDLKVRSETPYVDILNSVKQPQFAAKGSTTVNSWEGAKLQHTTGKSGVDFKFNSGKRAFGYLAANTQNLNFDQTNGIVDGGMPLAVDYKNSFGGYSNSTGAFATGSGPVFRNGWNVTGGPGSVPHGRRLAAAAAGRNFARKLLNPIYSEGNVLTGPETPSYRYRATPPPATYVNDLKVRSETPYVDILNSVKQPQFAAKGSTTVNSWEGAKLQHTTGKSGVDFKFNSGKRAFGYLTANTQNLNFDQTNGIVDGGMPLAVDYKNSFGGYSNSTGAFATGSGPVFRNGWNVTGGPGSVPHGRK